MPKRLLLFISLIMSASLLLIGCGNATNKASGETSEGNEHVYELSFNIQIPSTHKFHTDVVKPWTELVVKETNGRVKVNIYNSGALGTLATAYDDINGGLYDIGYVGPSLHMDSNLFPLTIGDLPFAFSDGHDTKKVLSKIQQTYMQDTFNESTLLSITSTDSYQLYSKKPVESIADVKGEKIIAQGADRIELVKGWKSVPVSLGLESIYESLEKNTVDQTTYTSVGAMGLKLYEVAPYLTKIDMGASTLLFLINSDSLHKLPDDLQKLLVEELGPKLGEMTADMYNNEAELAIKEYGEQVKSKGGKVITLDGEALKAFKKPSEEIWNTWIKTADKKGYPGEEIMDEFKRLLVEEGVEVPF